MGLKAHQGFESLTLRRLELARDTMFTCYYCKVMKTKVVNFFAYSFLSFNSLFSVIYYLNNWFFKCEAVVIRWGGTCLKDDPPIFPKLFFLPSEIFVVLFFTAGIPAILYILAWIYFYRKIEENLISKLIFLFTPLIFYFLGLMIWFIEK